MNLVNIVRSAGLGVALFALIGTCAHAKSVDVMNERFPSHLEDATVSASFQYNDQNADLNRAWVELELYQPSPSGDTSGETVVIRKQVSGLRYDSEAKQIVFDETGKSPVVCAKVIKNSFLFFHTTKVEPTTNCKLTAQKLPASSSTPGSSQDDGFVKRYNPVGRVVLAIKD